MCIKNPAVFGYSGGVYSSDGDSCGCFEYICVAVFMLLLWGNIATCSTLTFDSNCCHKYDECTDTGISGTAGYSRLVSLPTRQSKKEIKAFFYAILRAESEVFPLCINCIGFPALCKLSRIKCAPHRRTGPQWPFFFYVLLRVITCYYVSVRP